MLRTKACDVQYLGCLFPRHDLNWPRQLRIEGDPEVPSDVFPRDLIAKELYWPTPSHTTSSLNEEQRSQCSNLLRCPSRHLLSGIGWGKWFWRPCYLRRQPSPCDGKLLEYLPHTGLKRIGGVSPLWANQSSVQRVVDVIERKDFIKSPWMELGIYHCTR
jgi:hypothetical protein